MKIVIAPDSFKESLSAYTVAKTIADAFSRVLPNVECCCVPVADGGEGTMDALVDATQGSRHQVMVTGPLGEEVNATLGLLGDGVSAVIEMSQASGIELIKESDRNPLITTSYGTGELIKAALDKNVQKIIIALGGSVTNDGGAGMMSALGVQFLDSSKQPLAWGGEALSQLAYIDVSQLDARLKNVTITCACDVDNPLTGEFGASAIFGPQKGATKEQVIKLDKALSHYAAIIKDQIGIDVEHTPGAGAAGGLGAAVLAFMNAQLKQGVDLVLDTVKFEEKLLGASLVITGEGRIDSQTIYGKTPAGVAKKAQQQGIPTIAIAGAVGEGTENLKQVGIISCFSIMQGVSSLESALKDAQSNLSKTAEGVAHLLSLSVD